MLYKRVYNSNIDDNILLELYDAPEQYTSQGRPQPCKAGSSTDSPTVRNIFRYRL